MSSNFRFSSISDMLNKQATSRPNHVCLYYPDQVNPHTYVTLTYKQLNDVTDHLAQKYSKLIGENQRNATPIICMLANTSVDYLLTMYALLKLDVIVFLLSIRNSEAAIMHLLEKVNVSHLFYSNEYSSMSIKVATKFGSTVKHYRMETIHINELVECGESMFNSKIDINQLDQIHIIFHRYTLKLCFEHVYFVIFSSGSTSFPKPVRLTIRCVFGYYESYALEMNGRFWSEEDVVLSVMPL